MTPIYFQGRFGWIHPAKSPAESDAPQVGVVLCPAFAQEEVCTHYGLMALAEQLAAAGFPTIRFDYGGTGDSYDCVLSLEAMVADAVLAAACLRQQCGVGAIVMAGVRLGAAVALRAAGSLPDVTAMLLIAPVLSGQVYMRETRAAASVNSLSSFDPVPPAGSGLPLNTNGFVWSAALQAEIATIDLTATAAPAEVALLIPARGDRKPGTLAAAWRERGVTATDIAFVDYEGWMQDPTTNITPAATFTKITEWLGTVPHTVDGVTPATEIALEPMLTLPSCIEQPVQFGAGNTLFGVLCCPAGRAAEPIAALLLHQGSSHHIGNGRSYVELARRLADAGIASLRMDLTGMGDSPAGSNTRHPHYDPERIAEGVAGLDELERAGFTKAVTFGLCSGAHTALQVTLADTRVVGNSVLNLQKFIWHYGDDIRVTMSESRRSVKGYIRAMRNPGEWRRVLAGKADMAAIATVLLKRAVMRSLHAARSLLPPAPGSEVVLVRDQLRVLAERRVHSTFLFGNEDPGLAEMSMQFGRKASKLTNFAPARMLVLPRTDHHISMAARHAAPTSILPEI
jgi:alpha/beta superfamily hydrolase